MSELHDRFLQEQATEGTYDSEGQFTLGAQAVTKMAKYAFADESLWLVRMVQAAVAAGATSISIKQTVTATEILFEPGAAFYADEVIAALGTTEPYPGPAVSLLVSGLQAVAMGQNRAFSLEFTDHLRYRYVSYLRGKLCVGDSANERKVTQKQQIKLSVAWPGYYRHTALPEMATLTERARICPIEVRLDGRVINNVFAPKPPETETSRAYLAVGGLIGQGQTLQEFWGPAALYSTSNFGISDKFTDRRPVVKMRVPVSPILGLFQLFYHYRVLNWGYGKSVAFEFGVKPEKTIVHWLRFGVISESEELPWDPQGVSAHIYLDASDLPTDASGFRLRASLESREARIKESLTLLAPNLHEVIQGIDGLWPRPFDRQMLCLLFFSGAQSFYLPSPFQFFQLAMLGLLGLGWTAHKKSILDSCRKELRKYVASLSVETQLSTRPNIPAGPWQR